MRTDEIRQKFLEFFKSKGHEIVASDSLVPTDDPTLLFTGAGMNQFKEKFLGRNITYRRAASSQKCLRTGDLENVGRTAGHHTFFEMLGNFSFGDYFKKEAIQWAWEFLTKILKIPPEKLWVSVYKDDIEAYDIWKDVIKIPVKKIVKLGEKENFWPSEAPTKGPNGPCGPCSEIFYDWGEGAGCGEKGCTPECGCSRFVEVWNLVFTQFDRENNGKLKSLPNKNIDTGMGLERIAAVMRGVLTNFEIDIFKPIIQEIEKASKCQKIKAQNANAIADHIRAVTFAIADGVMPSNEERGYVVRKLIRRAITHSNNLKIKGPFLYKLVSMVADVMKGQYPDLKSRREDIAEIVKREEEAFKFVIENQLPKVEEMFSKLKGSRDAKRIAEAAFNFYDTYGMPYDMLEECSERFGFKIERALFDSLLDAQRARSRAKTKISSEIFSETFAKKVESLHLKTEFLGYEDTAAEAAVLAVLDGGEVILDKTPFYGESGGQVGDWGEIDTPSGRMEVEDAKRINETIVHIGKMLSGSIVKGEKAHVKINEESRKNIMRNHTATHLLQAALKKVLGEHVRQTGSLVDEGHLRFDFTHSKKMDERELHRVEELVNEAVKKAIPVKKETKSLVTARLEGATALFNEKYGGTVRVVTISDVSKELCGGTHVDNTAEIAAFKIRSESSIASGVRRIEALTGGPALKWVEDEKKAEDARLEIERGRGIEKSMLKKHLQEELAKVDDIISRAKAIGSSKFVFEKLSGLDMDGLRAIADAVRKKEKSAIIIFASENADKLSFVAALTNDLVKKGLNASNIAKDLAKSIDGSGGGRPDFAQGGGKSPKKLELAIKATLESIKEKLI